MKISVVTTLYYSEPYIKEFYERIKAILVELELEYEMIFVNDGSPDGSLDIVLQIIEDDHSVKVLDLSRNFGHHKAIMAGLKETSGDLIFLMDCDLEEEPELLKDFYKMLASRNDVDVIYGVQKQREGSWFRKISSDVFVHMLSFFSRDKLQNRSTLTRIMTRRYLDKLLLFRESNIVMGVLFQEIGFKQETILVRKKYKGTTTYTISRRLQMAIGVITSLSTQPLLLIGVVGFFIAITAFFYALFLIYCKLVFGMIIDGWASLIVSVWFIGGSIILSVGVVGIYIAEIFTEVKDRPSTIVRQIYLKKQKG